MTKDLPIKVLITGAFASGKTTLVNALGQAFTQKQINAAIVPDSARRCPFPLNLEQNFLTSAWLIGEQIRAETEAA